MKLLDPTDTNDVPKFLFYNSALMTLDGFVVFSKRYAEIAKEMVKREKNARRRKELQKVADVCSWVPFNSPRDFWEAVQSFWFTHLAVRLETSGHSLSPGRFDQYMFPFYEKDSTPNKNQLALELIECLFIKFSELMLFSSRDTSTFYTGAPQWQNLNLGGRNREGQDATNELSYFCLEAMAETRLVQPDISVRIHRDTPEAFLIKAIELAKLGTGHPKFYNEDLIALSMASKGVSIGEARNFSIMGCVEPRVTSKEGSHLTGGFINLPAAVELGLTGGIWRLTGKRVGVSTGDPTKFESFDAFMAAYKAQLAEMIRHMFIVNAIAETAYSELISTPFLSVITEGCIQKGKDLQHGGAIYNFGPSVNAIGIADTADSLYAIKKCVFDDGIITMSQLLEALEWDFEGFEKLRKTLLFDTAKFGNDIEEVDKIAHDAVQFFNEECMKYKNIFGGIAQGGIIPVTAGIPFGKVVGALPSGRKAGQAYADGSSPSPGNDKKGPTAIIRSVARLDLARLRNGDLLNMRLTPLTVSTDVGIKKLASFLRGFCDVGGWHIQFNVVDTKTLLDAQEHPDKYPDLLVRVAGYSSYFAQLHKEVQDDIIRRTEHCF